MDRNHEPLHDVKEIDGLISGTPMLRRPTKKTASWSRVCLIVSVAVNILLVLGGFGYREHVKASDKTRFAKLAWDQPQLYKVHSPYNGENETLADELWESIDLNSGAVAISDEYAAAHNLLPAQRFPWDSTKGIYYVEGIHDLHCLKLMRHAFVELDRGWERRVSRHHLMHCFDALRMRVMCQASDTLLPTHPDRPTGEGQPIVCRNWDALIDWALQPERNACFDLYDQYATATGLRRFTNCPDNSIYLSTMKAYVAKFGLTTLPTEHPE